MYSAVRQADSASDTSLKNQTAARHAEHYARHVHILAPSDHTPGTLHGKQLGTQSKVKQRPHLKGSLSLVLAA